MLLSTNATPLMERFPVDDLRPPKGNPSLRAATACRRADSYAVSSASSALTLSPRRAATARALQQGAVDGNGDVLLGGHGHFG
jgi:hypothetical protein